MPRRYSDADLRAMIPLYLEGALDDDELAAVLVYCAEHPEALQACAESSRLIDVLDEAITPVAVDPQFTGSVLAEIESLTPAGRWRAELGNLPALTLVRWAAEAALLGLLLLVLLLHPWAPTINPVQCELLGQSRWTLGQPAAVRVIVRHRSVAQPVVNAQVRLRLLGDRSRETIFRGRTNDEGTVDLEIPLPADQPAGEYRLVAEAETPLGRAVVQHPLRLVTAAGLRVEPVADRVQVGDDLRAWLNVSPAASAGVEWRLDDRLGRALAQGQLELPASRQGLLEIPLGGHAPPGPATLWVRSGEDAVATAIGILPRAEGELEPRIEIISLTPRLIAGRVELTLPPHQAVAGAPVGLKLKARAWSTRLHGRTDDGGIWRWSVPLPAGIDRRLLLQAFARDSLARRGEAWRSVAIPASLTLTGRPSGELIEGLDTAIELAASEPVDAINWSWNGQPWQTAAGPQAAIRVRPRAGANRLRLRALGPEGWVRTDRSLSARPAASGLLVRPARRSVSGGESVRVDVRSPGRESPVYLDLLAGGRTIATRSLTLANGRGSLVLHLPIALPTEVTLRAYAPAGDRWRQGQASLAVRPAAPLRVEIADPTAAGFEITARRGESLADQPLLLAAVPWGDDEPVHPRRETSAQPPFGFDLVANSVAAAGRQALARQREFFEQSPLLGGIAGGLLLACFLLWFVQLFRDPFEYVNRRERRVWGRVPQVHRRGTWAGLGVLLVAVVAAAGLSGGILLAGRQARELANRATEPLDTWQPREASWLPAALGPLSRNLAWAVSTAPNSAPPPRIQTQWLQPREDGRAIAAPLSAGRWRVLAFSSGSPPTSASLEVRGQPTLEVAAPTRLRIGDEVSLRVTLLNPTDQRLPAVVEATTEPGLDLAGAPTQRVVLEPISRLDLDFPVRASEYGRPRLTVTATPTEHEPLVTERQIEVLPDAPRQELSWSGWISAETDLRFDLPAGASARTLRITATDDPLARWDEALAATVQQPIASLRDLLGLADAAALRHRLLAHSARDAAPRQQAARRQLLDSYQRLLAYEVVADGARPTGAFALQPGGVAEPAWTAQTLLVLRRIDREIPIDPALLERSRDWLMTRLDSPTDVSPLDDQPARSLQLRARTIYALLGDGQPAGLEIVARELLQQTAEAQDLETVAALAEVAAFAGLDSSRRHEILSRLVDYRYRREDGSNWYPGAKATAFGASGRGAAIETSAIAVRALARAGGRWSAVAEEGRDYLLAQRLPDGGWGAPWLTALAIRAVTQLEPIPAPARGLLFCGVDDEPMQRRTFEGSRHDFEWLVSPAPGEHTVRLRFIGRGRPAYRVQLAYTQSDLPAPSGLVAAAAFDRTEARVGQPVMLTMGVTNPSGERLNLVVAEVTLPAGFAAEGDPLQADDRLRLLVGDLAPGERRTIQVALRPQTTGRLQPFDIQLRTLYDPGVGALASLPRLTVT